MDNVLYVGLSRQMVLQHEIEVIANNVANVDTTGFKVEALMVQTDPEKVKSGGAGSPLNNSVNFPLDAGVVRDFSQGELKRTGGDFDVGIQGDGGDITLDPKKGPPSISADGTVSQQGQQVGKIALVNFDSLSALTKQGAGMFSNDTNLQPTAATGKIRQGVLEQSNVQPILQITRLIQVSRAYENVSQMMDQNGQLSTNAIDRLGKLSTN